ncbi:MAG: MFS transporter [Actinomycetes bacterium]
MKRYIDFFRTPQVVPLFLASFPARIAYGMIALSVFFKAQHETGSIAFAGLAIGITSVAGSASAGIRSSVIDLFGQKWPLRILVPGYTSMLIVLSFAHTRQTILSFAFLLGISAPPINLSVRPLWKAIVSEDLIRSAYAIDTSVINTAGVIGPVIATALSLSSHPQLALLSAACLMALGGGALSINPVSRAWIPEKKKAGQKPLWKHRAIQLLMIEAIFIGFGWGVFDVAVPAFATIEKVPSRTAWILAAMGIASILGGIAAGIVSKRYSPLGWFIRNYFLWFIFTLPLAFTYPGWSLALVGACLGFIGGAQQVFYWEVLEAIRPLGSEVSSIGWLWTIEGSFMALGSAVGGYVSQEFSPRIALAITPTCIAIGTILLVLGRSWLAEANLVPKPENDLRAMRDNSDETN